ncbi:MAG: type IV pilin-like G/H family protein, partial [Synechococcus sp.]|nr:type IV pilin-like G/H family protein [Synechococcus sp.]
MMLYLLWKTRRESIQGLTIIELLIVIVIIGILSAVSLPVVLSVVARARQSEAKATLSVLNRAQQLYFLENSSFSPDILNLGAITVLETSNFSYSNAGALLDYSLGAAYVATAQDPGRVQDYSAGVTSLAASGVPSIICEEDGADVAGPVPP